jgi:hypothetical protein
MCTGAAAMITAVVRIVQLFTLSGEGHNFSYETFAYIFCLLTSWSRVLLEKLTGFQLVKKFPALYRTRRFITAFTIANSLSLPWATPIQSMPSHPTSWRYVLILSSYLSLGLPSGLFPSGFPTKTLYTSLLSPIRATCPAHLILLDFISNGVTDPKLVPRRGFF